MQRIKQTIAYFSINTVKDRFLKGVSLSRQTNTNTLSLNHLYATDIIYLSRKVEV